MPVYRQTTAQGHHTRSKASKTRITSGTAAVAQPVGVNWSGAIRVIKGGARKMHEERQGKMVTNTSEEKKC